MKTFLLTDGTVGQADAGEAGETITVSLHDENGSPIEVTGVVESEL